HQMAEGDELIWYYGAWNDKPLRVVHDVTTVAVGDSTTAVVQEYANSSWSPYAGATLKVGSATFQSGANGQVSLSWTQNGTYYLAAEAAGHVRSDAVLVVAGEAGEQASMPLSANISTEVGSGPGSNPAPELGGVSFGVSGDLSFGTLAPGSTATRQAMLSNNASGGITTTASVSGSSLFTDHITLDNVIPGQWQKSIIASASAAVGVTLSVPSSYAGTGSESGTLTFWAHASN
ncbi:MAG: hypothetical protein U1C18_00595, partial [Patescibacteria group bacterium]|nr:hypothetical protein [Patescibacteria group bacterium]